MYSKYINVGSIALCTEADWKNIKWKIKNSSVKKFLNFSKYDDKVLYIYFHFYFILYISYFCTEKKTKKKQKRKTYRTQSREKLNWVPTNKCLSKVYECILGLTKIEAKVETERKSYM